MYEDTYNRGSLDNAQVYIHHAYHILLLYSNSTILGYYSIKFILLWRIQPFKRSVLKGMVNSMVDSTTIVLRTWENSVDNEEGVADIRVDEDLRRVSADIISRACFGSSYSQGKDIFLKLRTLQKIMSKGFSYTGVPGWR